MLYLTTILYTDKVFDKSGVQFVNNYIPTDDDNATTDLVYPFHGVMINKNTYFMGLRVTTNRAVRSKVREDDYEVINLAKSNYFSWTDSKMSNLNKTSFPYNYSEGGGYKNNGGFVMFIKGNTTLTEANKTVTDMINKKWF